MSPDSHSESAAGHILTLSPPLNLDPRWAGEHLAYTMAKYGMSLTTLGLAEELRGDEISVNSLWPRTLIATAAVQNVLGGSAATSRSRTPEIVADAAYVVLTGRRSGEFLIDDEVLAEVGVTDFSQYRLAASDEDLAPDIFLDSL